MDLFTNRRILHLDDIFLFGILCIHMNNQHRTTGEKKQSFFFGFFFARTVVG